MIDNLLQLEMGGIEPVPPVMPPPAGEKPPANGSAAKWIEFREFKAAPGSKTRRWAVCAKGTLKAIGFVMWHGPWRKYAFHPNAATVYEWDCLRDIAGFCQRQTLEHRKAKK